MPRFTKEMITLTLGVNKEHNEGKKTLTGKPEWALLPIEALEGVVRVFEYGFKKYGNTRTWLPGIRFSLLFSAMCRHLFDWFFFGKDKDKESDQHPLCHVIANAMMLLTFIDTSKFDDRGHSLVNKLMSREAIYAMMVSELEEAVQKQGEKNDNS